MQVRLYNVANPVLCDSDDIQQGENRYLYDIIHSSLLIVYVMAKTEKKCEDER